MLRVSLVLRLICAAFLAATVTIGVPFSASAAKKTKFANGPISVRLCPARCLEVKRHPYKAGGVATVYETQGGWARVSEHIDPARLKAFGGNIPEKPAFWVRTRQLADANISVAAKAPATEDKAAKEPEKKAVKKSTKKRFVQRRRVTLPRFRPDVAIQVASLTDTETSAPAVAEPVMEDTAKPAISSDVNKVEQPAASEPKESAIAKPADQPEPKPEMKPKDSAENDDAVVMKKPDEESKPEKKVTYNAPKAEEPSASLNPESGKSEERIPKGVQTLTEADKFVAPAPSKVEQPDIQNKPSTEVSSEQKVIKEVIEAPAKDQTKPADEVAVASLEPQPENTDVVPLATEERPKTYTKALRDKRLRKLPGSKDKRFKIAEVIALRHHALMLLKNEECGGIVGGGRSAGQPGMLFVVCQEDPTYMRQFPLEEQTW